MHMGPWHVENRTGERLLRCNKACLASRGYPRSLEGRRNHPVSILSSTVIFRTHFQTRNSLIGVPSATVYMLTYDHLLREVLPPLIPSPTLVPLTAGILARTFITTLASPLELVRTNLQSTPPSPDNPHTLRSVLTSIRGLTQAQGIPYLWRGVVPSLWRDVPFSGLYWAGYETCKRQFEKEGYSGAPVAFVSGAISGTTAALLTSPFDVLKTRRQAFVMSQPGKTAATIPLFMEILQTEGPSALYAGILPRIVKIAPACGIMIACFEVHSHFVRSTFTSD